MKSGVSRSVLCGRGPASVLLTSLLAALTGCPVTDGGTLLPPDLNELVEEFREAARNTGRLAGVRDGTSNTVLLGETAGSSDGIGGADRGSRESGDAAADVPGLAGDTPGTSDADAPRESTPGDTGTDDGTALLKSELGDKFLEFGSSSSFSSGSITETNELQLCAFGRFGMRVTRITSTGFNDFSSEETLLGTWVVAVENGQPVLVLNVDEASDPNEIGTRAFLLAIDAGQLLIDGNPTSVSDATADCAAARG